MNHPVYIIVHHWVFLNDQCFSVLRLRVTSKKSVCIMFASIVIFKLCFWKSFIILFLIRSVLGPLEFWRITKPSSLYKPVRSLGMIVESLCKRNSPTSSHTYFCSVVRAHCYVKFTIVFFDPRTIITE